MRLLEGHRQVIRLSTQVYEKIAQGEEVPEAGVSWGRHQFPGRIGGVVARASHLVQQEATSNKGHPH